MFNTKLPHYLAVVFNVVSRKMKGRDFTRKEFLREIVKVGERRIFIEDKSDTEKFEHGEMPFWMYRHRSGERAYAHKLIIKIDRYLEVMK